MSDEDDDPAPGLRDVAVDARGNLRPRRVLDALRGRRSRDLDLVPWLVAGLSVALVRGAGAGYADYGTLAGAAETAVTFLVGYVVVAVVVAVDRVTDYYSGDREVAVEELRRRYADGEIDLGEFRRRIDRVYEEGPETVWGDGTEGVGDGSDAPDGPGASRGTDRDPAAILRARYARGEIDEPEFRRRMAVLGEPVDPGSEGEPAADADARRAVERES